MSLPMITFSLSPRSRSTLPLLAALRQGLRVPLLVLPLRDDLAREQARVAGRVDADLPHHLPDDDLDVLVVDIDTLRPVHLLDLVHEERLHRLLAEDVKQLLW